MAKQWRRLDLAVLLQYLGHGGALEMFICQLCGKRSHASRTGGRSELQLGPAAPCALQTSSSVFRFLSRFGELKSGGLLAWCEETLHHTRLASSASAIDPFSCLLSCTPGSQRFRCLSQLSRGRGQGGGKEVDAASPRRNSSAYIFT